MKLLGIVAILVVISGIAGFLFMRSGGRVSTPGPVETPLTSIAPTSTAVVSTTPRDDGAFSGSLVDLIRGGQGRVCTYGSKDGETSSENTVYAGNEQFALEGKITTKAGVMAMNMVGDKNTAKTWFEIPGAGKIGQIIDLKAAQAKGTPSPQQMQQANQIMAKFDFHCSPWTVDEAKFVVPADVVFRGASIPSPSSN